MAINSPHRSIISANLTTLSDATSLSKRLLNVCVERKIITGDERTKINRTGDLDDYETKSYFYDNVLKLKDAATFEKFLDVAKEDEIKLSGVVINILNQGLTGTDDDDADGGSGRSLPEFNFGNKTRCDGISFKDAPWKSPFPAHEVKPLERYKIRPNARFALIVNITSFEERMDRLGAQRDSVAMATVLKGHGFHVSEIEDHIQITAQDFKNKLKQFKNLCKNGDTCIVSIMSHGTRNYIVTSDDAGLSIHTDILAEFNNVNFKEFVGKPKIFIIQACRGREPECRWRARMDLTAESDYGVRTMRDEATFTKHCKSSCLKIPTWTDMLVCHATLEGQYSNREDDGSSWFIQVLCGMIQAHGKQFDINRILSMVAEQMKSEEGSGGEKQICPWTNIGFTKEFRF